MALYMALLALPPYAAACNRGCARVCSMRPRAHAHAQDDGGRQGREQRPEEEAHLALQQGRPAVPRGPYPPSAQGARCSRCYIFPACTREGNTPGVLCV
eukprot:1140518-Pelagomonas_calceolata.AAC.2